MALRALLVQDLTHDSLTAAKELINDAKAVFWKHGLEVVPPAHR